MERLRSPGFTRAVVWASALVLVAGVVAFVTVRLGSSDSPPAADRGSVPSGYSSEDLPGVDTQTTPKESDVPKEAREAAGEFVLSAVGRENLPKAWTLADQEAKQACNCTYKQWLTGDIPVQYFPRRPQGRCVLDQRGDPIRRAPGAALPGKNEDGLGRRSLHRPAQRGGKNSPWRVDYWAPVNVARCPHTGRRR
jgi:hypothetical protein